MKLAVGVMGSASGVFPNATREALRALGSAIAERNCALITGACPGLSFEAVLGARARAGLVIGISPALSLHEHVEKYGSPTDGFDVLIYTGSGLMGREIENIRSSDIVIISGGSSGTLGEFAIAYDEGRLIGVLTGTGGIADQLQNLIPMLRKPTGATVMYDDNPVRLLDRLLDFYYTEHYRQPNCFAKPPASESTAPATPDSKAAPHL